jgi:hypothetical protein
MKYTHNINELAEQVHYAFILRKLSTQYEYSHEAKFVLFLRKGNQFH